MRLPRPALILAAITTLAGGTLLFLLASASANTALFAHNYPLLMVLNALLIASLLIAVLVQLVALRREYKQGVFGARLKSRLLLMLTLMALLPGLLIYGVSLQFVMNSIDSWFDVRVDRALEGGLQLARNVLDDQLNDLHEQAQAMALQLGNQTSISPARLNRLREQNGMDTATVLSASGEVLAHGTHHTDTLMPELPNATQLREARQPHGYAGLEGEASNTLQLRVLVTISDTHTLEPRILQITRLVPTSIAQSASSVEAAYRDYQEISLGRQGLNRIYILALTLTLLLALFAAMMLALFLARRLAAPLLILAEGTQAVAAGDFTPRAELPSHDELGVLTQSFNRMTRQLADARQETERHRTRVEASSAYLESVLANLSSGVMAFDRQFLLRANNRGACSILDDELRAVDNIPLPQWQGHEAFRNAILQGFQPSADATQDEWQQQVEIDSSESAGLSTQVLLVRGSTLPEASGGGYVVVFDDITRLIAAQRSLAWAEVARRLAHEIKNPLTPIQLSAERLQLKLAEKLEPDARAMLTRSTQTIVTQVEALKTMVNEFRDYARMPPAQLLPLDLNALIRDVLELYDHAGVRISTRLLAGLPAIAGDASQLRQVIHNLLTNAQEAEEEAQRQRADYSSAISISTELQGNGRQRVVLAVRDHGNGFPPHILSHAFEPYITTKPRGTGLGLAIVKKIIDEHRGSILLANRPEGGAEIQIHLPVLQAVTPPPSQEV